MYERLEVPHKMPVKKLFKNCHIKSEFDLLFKNGKKRKRERKRKKYKPDGNIFVLKSKYYHQLLPKNVEQGFTTNLIYSLNQNISK